MLRRSLAKTIAPEVASSGQFLAESYSNRPLNYEIFIAPQTYKSRMDELMKFLTADSNRGFSVHNWMLIVGGIMVLWIIVLAKDA